MEIFPGVPRGRSGWAYMLRVERARREGRGWGRRWATPTPPTALRRTGGRSRSAWIDMVWANDLERVKGGISRWIRYACSEGRQTETETEDKLRSSQPKPSSNLFSTMTKVKAPVAVAQSGGQPNPSQISPPVTMSLLTRVRSDATVCPGSSCTQPRTLTRASREGYTSRSRQKTSSHSYNVQTYNGTEFPSFSIAYSISTFCHSVTKSAFPKPSPNRHRQRHQSTTSAPRLRRESAIYNGSVSLLLSC